MKRVDIPLRNDHIVRLYRKCGSAHEVALHLNMSVSSVRKIVRESGFSFSKKKNFNPRQTSMLISESREIEIDELHRSGMKLDKIGEIYGIKKSAVSKILKKVKDKRFEQLSAPSEQPAGRMPCGWVTRRCFHASDCYLSDKCSAAFHQGGTVHSNIKGAKAK